jgi:hypothetical protein
MSDSTNSNSKPAGATASTAAKGNIAGRLRSYWWIPVAYLIPYMIAHGVPATTAEQVTLRSHYMGLIGLTMAVVIFILWRLDCSYGARQLLHLSGDNQAKILIHILGIALWTCWVGIGVVFCMAHEQVHDLVPALPGLQAPL